MVSIWDEKYSVGIGVIDEQHKQFVFMLDKLSMAIGQLTTKEVLIQILNDLDQYVIYHFGTEEKYFKEFNYAGAPEHIREHRNFVERLAEIKDKFAKDQLRLSLELVSFMSDWLVNHVADMDRKYIKCFNEHGLY
jgi:hemerythrin